MNVIKIQLLLLLLLNTVRSPFFLALGPGESGVERLAGDLGLRRRSGRDARGSD